MLSVVSLPQFHTMPLGHVRDPFFHPEWIFEVKWDGFRALLYSDENGIPFVSRNRNVFKSFPGLCDGLCRDLKGRRCVLDGEIVCLDSRPTALAAKLGLVDGSGNPAPVGQNGSFSAPRSLSLPASGRSLLSGSDRSSRTVLAKREAELSATRLDKTYKSLH
jgi:ATP dependent DNA ligase domain